MADPMSAIDIDRLVRDHHVAVYQCAYRLSGTESDAEDLTQQVFLTAQEHLAQLRRTEHARAWLMAILRHLFYKLERRKRRLPLVELDPHFHSLAVEPTELEEIDSRALQQALDDLPAPFRVVLVMFYFEECSYREIAERLELPVGTVMSRLARGKAHLRDRLHEAAVAALRAAANR
ncbi:MAG: RNA polymerase sigma factor [Planctomycetota bacterium]